MWVMIESTVVLDRENLNDEQRVKNGYDKVPNEMVKKDEWHLIEMRMNCMETVKANTHLNVNKICELKIGKLAIFIFHTSGL